MRLQRARVNRVPLEASVTFQSPRTGAVMTILSVPDGDKDELKVERVLKPGQRWTPEHVHLDFSEHFRVLEGIADAEIGGSSRRLAAGEGLYVGKGTRHTNLRNRDIEDLVYEQTFTPATEGARSYVRTLAQVLRDGRDVDGELPWSLVFAIGDVTGERTYALRLPYLLQRKLLLPVGNVVAGTRRFEVQLTRQSRKRAAGGASAQSAGEAR